MRPILYKVTAPLLCAALLFGCSHKANSSQANGNSQTQEIIDEINNVVSYKDEDYYTEWKNESLTHIQLNGANASFEGDGAVDIKNNTISINSSGVYEISGKLDDGQIIVNTDSKDKGLVRLILNGVEIHSSTTAPIFVKNAGKTVISLPEGTENTLSDPEKYVYTDSSEDEPNGALYSRDDLTINGSGKLAIKANYNNGIVGKDNLKITGGDITVEAADDAIVGRDLLAIKDGSFHLKAGGDGMKSTNDEKDTKGTIVIEDGTFEINTDSDGIQSVQSLFIAGGDFSIVTGDGSPEKIESHEGMGMNMPGPWQGGSDDSTVPNGQAAANTDNPKGNPDTNTSTNTTTDETDSVSSKGLKAEVKIGIGGGTFEIDSLDDAVHSNDSVVLTGGKMKIATGDDGIHADSSVQVIDGDFNIIKSYEGVEGTSITIDGGKLHMNTNDDGVNVGGGNDGSGMGMGPRPQDDFDKGAGSEENATSGTEVAPEKATKTTAEGDSNNGEETETPPMLTINGGYVYVNSEGDGLDSNGSISMTGGTVIVNGPTTNGNGALDYDQSFVISGGILIAAGSSGMAMATSEESTQNTMIMTYPDTQKAGTLASLVDSKGNTIVSFAPEKDYQTIVISSPKLEKDSSYTLYSGGSSSGKEEDGFYTDGEFEGGTKVVDFTLANSVTWLDETGITEAKSGFGGPGGGPGGQGNMGQPPTDKGNRGDMFSDLDEATRARVQEIMEKERAGEITREEAQAQLSELGIEFPGGKR